MDERKRTDAIIISADDARGARGPEKGTAGDTLLPMLITMIVLTALGVAIVAIIAGI